MCTRARPVSSRPWESPSFAAVSFKAGMVPPIVVSRLLARTFWPKADPIGKTITVNGVSVTVVGVAKDVDPVRFGGSENPPLYLMRGAHPNRNVLSVRFDSDPKAGVLAVRAALREFDPGLFVVARVLQSWIDQVTEVLWNVVSLIVFLGLVATVLATTGIYGAVSFAVNQQTRDLGIRLALGATPLRYRAGSLCLRRQAGGARAVHRVVALRCAGGFAAAEHEGHAVTAG